MIIQRSLTIIKRSITGCVTTCITTGLALSNLAFAQPPQACNCLWQGSFSQITDQADLIVSGKVIASKGNSLDLSIERTLIDRNTDYKEFKPVIRLWADNGKLCRPDSKDFSINSRWVMALKKITEDIPGGFNPNTPNISYGRINDYYLSKCGAYWLHLGEGYVSGNLAKGHRWQWDNKKMNPVLLDLIAAYIKGSISEQSLIEAAKPRTEAKKLMKETQRFIQQQ